MLDSALLALAVVLLALIYVRLCMIYKVVSLRPVAVPAPSDLAAMRAAARAERPLMAGDMVLAEVVPIAEPGMSHHCGHTTAEHVAYTDGTRACQACHDDHSK